MIVSFVSLYYRSGAGQQNSIAIVIPEQGITIDEQFCWPTPVIYDHIIVLLYLRTGVGQQNSITIVIPEYRITIEEQFCWPTPVIYDSIIYITV
ncbi:MAG: hypothetical protein Barrevirus1_2 [Barrevirus sp.]|uniref:Uncharacterized protein n=1 Tax=Barrevirus sp. TaxID=2487763 RepID=A0A3G4ZPG8_9VIRU|nr:MAG: hypothetical protein Barrevirus1_2 [Barrevirus sp.]